MGTLRATIAHKGETMEFLQDRRAALINHLKTYTRQEDWDGVRIVARKLLIIEAQRRHQLKQTIARPEFGKLELVHSNN